MPFGDNLTDNGRKLTAFLIEHPAAMAKVDQLGSTLGNSLGLYIVNDDLIHRLNGDGEDYRPMLGQVLACDLSNNPPTPVAAILGDGSFIDLR